MGNIDSEPTWGPTPEPPSPGSGMPLGPAQQPHTVRYPDPENPRSPFYGDRAEIPESTPAFPRRHSDSRGVIAAVLVASVAFACVGFLAGRLTAPKPGSLAKVPTSARADDASTGGAAISSGISVTDPAGDAVVGPGKVYGPSDITNLSLRTEGTDLVVTIAFTPSTPMDLILVGTAIRLDPQKVPNCRDNVLDSFDLSLDYADEDVEVSKWGDSCDAGPEPTRMMGSFDITGSTLTIRVDYGRLGIQPGQQIVVRSCVSTVVEKGHISTTIQDWAPDSKGGATGSV